MSEIQCQNCGATYETEYPLHGTITTLIECAICDREDDNNPDEETPAPKPVRKLRGPYKKKPVPESYKSLSGKKFTKQVLEFLRQNCDTKDNEMLAQAVRDKFGFSTTKAGVTWQMSHNGIKRKYPYHIKINKSKSVAGEKDLQTLPPPDY